uniref:Uncharacterized protein n=1 Tax=Acrobeloides nanus TaxID=290746 RepID=A0A914E5P5_9BILA
MLKPIFSQDYNYENYVLRNLIRRILNQEYGLGGINGRNGISPNIQYPNPPIIRGLGANQPVVSEIQETRVDIPLNGPNTGIINRNLPSIGELNQFNPLYGNINSNLLANQLAINQGIGSENLATNSLSSNQLLGNQYYNGLSYNGVNYNGNILAFLQSLQTRGLINPVMRDGLYNDPSIGPILQNLIRQGQLGGNFWMNGAGHCSGVA